MSLLTTLKTPLHVTIAAALLFSIPLWGQEFRGTITGTVVDPTGAAMPKADVEARNTDTAAITRAKTDDSGVYTIPFLLPGTYTLTITANGFKKAVREHIEVHTGDKIQTDVQMQVGATSESVTVTGESE
jgi:hypothetical protein